jgi:hypothetical protein
VGTKVAQGDTIFYFHDDVILSSEYIEKVLKVYEEDQKKSFGGLQDVFLGKAEGYQGHGFLGWKNCGKRFQIFPGKFTD